jgi:hypothetical protein
MALLQRTDRSFADPEDRVVAPLGDLQGCGGRQPEYHSERV